MKEEEGGFMTVSGNDPVLFFDGVCNLCNQAVQFVIRHDKKAVFRFAPLQSEFGQKVLAENKLPKNHFNSLKNNKKMALHSKNQAVNYLQINYMLKQFSSLCFI